MIGYSARASSLITPATNRIHVLPSAESALPKLVLLVTHSSAGGAQEIWANLAEGFRKEGHEVTLMALYPLRETVRDTGTDFEWIYVAPRRPRSPIAAAKLVTGFVKWIRAHRPDVILTALPAANIMAAVCARLANVGTRVILSHHSPSETHNPVLDRLDGFTGSLKSVGHVVSVSNAVSQSLERKPLAYRSKRAIIHNALPPRIEQAIADNVRQRAAHWQPGRVVVATGRLAAQKNYPLLIRASALMPDVEIRIVGNGPDEEQLKALAREIGVHERVQFLGHRPREEALAILATADIFAQVSLYEGHSLALVEAARMGIPLVVSDVPVQIEGITADDGSRCGEVVPIDDPSMLAGAILHLLDDPLAWTGAAAAAKKLGEGASYSAMIQSYRQLF